MASIRRRGSAWRAELHKDGKRESGTFPTKATAVAWAMQREAELVGAQLPDHSVKDALDRYEREVVPSHKGSRWEMTRLRMIGRDALASVRLPALRPAHVASWKERRLVSVTGASVRREMNLLQSVFRVARREWGWLHADPLADVAKPRSPASRKRRILQDEIDRLVSALGYDGGMAETISDRVALAFEFAIETAMRASEICGLTPADVGALSVRLPRTKNGDERQVPLSSRAREILTLLPAGRPTVFDLQTGSRDALFRKARAAAGIDNLHFHDSRAEAIWRLSKKLDVLELARVIGHRDLKSLLIYYQTSADDLAAKLG